MEKEKTYKKQTNKKNHLLLILRFSYYPGHSGLNVWAYFFFLWENCLSVFQRLRTFLCASGAEVCRVDLLQRKKGKQRPFGPLKWVHDLFVLSNWQLTKEADGHSRFPGHVWFQHMELQRCHSLAMASPPPRSGRGTAMASGRTRGKEATWIPVLEMVPAGCAREPHF